MFLAIFLFLVGLGVLIFGAESMVRGSASLARKMRIAPIVIGLTIVAFGTSAPELIVNLFSAFRGSADIAIGNVIGSNIANIFLILGLSALVVPLVVKKNTVWKEIPFALLGVVLVVLMGNDAFFDKTNFNALTRTDGFSLMAIFVIFLYYIVSLARTEKSNEDEEIKVYSWPTSILLIITGLAGLFAGGKIVVDNAIILARIAGLSEAFIGLTIVAVGTSLPELATSVVAAMRGHNDIAIGNIVGSNIFNVFWILGLTSVIINLPFNVAVTTDVLVSVLATFLLFLAMFVGKKHQLERWQGVAFLMLYFVYISYLVIRG